MNVKITSDDYWLSGSDMIDWLRTLKKDSFLIKTYSYTIIKFKNDIDLVAFKLKFGL